jgi:hypothetical protein
MLGNMETPLKTLTEAVKGRADGDTLITIIEELTEAVTGERQFEPYTLDLLQRVHHYFRTRGLLDKVDPGVWDILGKHWTTWWWAMMPEERWTLPGLVAKVVHAMSEGDWDRAASQCHSLISMDHATIGSYLLARVREAAGEVSQTREHPSQRPPPNVPEPALWDYLIEVYGKRPGPGEEEPVGEPGLPTRTLIYLVSSAERAWVRKDWPGALRACRQMEEEMQAGDLADYMRGRTYERLGDRAGAQASLRRCLETTRSPGLGAETAEALRRLAG